MRRMKTTIAILVLAAAFACSKDKPKAVKTTPEVAQEPDAPPSTPTASVEKDTPVSPSLAMSGDLAEICKIKSNMTTKHNPQFDYDKDELTTEDRAVLDQLATCLISGPAKDKAVSLIGRADPRGTEEYNLGLGSRRAASVSQYLGRMLRRNDVGVCLHDPPVGPDQIRDSARIARVIRIVGIPRVARHPRKAQ